MTFGNPTDCPSALRTAIYTAVSEAAPELIGAALTGACKRVRDRIVRALQQRQGLGATAVNNPTDIGRWVQADVDAAVELEFPE